MKIYQTKDGKRIVSNNIEIFIKTSKKKDWISDAVKKPGSFKEYCGGKVTEECIEKGLKSEDIKVRRRANLAKTFRKMKKKKEK